jgi:hypothetical protein
VSTADLDLDEFLGLDMAGTYGFSKTPGERGSESEFVVGGGGGGNNDGWCEESIPEQN